MSSADNTDTEADETFINDSLPGKKEEETIYIADDENEEEMKELKTKEVPTRSSFKICHICEEQNDNNLPLCEKCWNKKNEWVKKPKLKKKKIRKGYSEKSEENGSLVKTLMKKDNTLKEEENKCNMCENKPKNAIFIHGKLGHQV